MSNLNEKIKQVLEVADKFSNLERKLNELSKIKKEQKKDEGDNLKSELVELSNIVKSKNDDFDNLTLQFDSLRRGTGENIENLRRDLTKKIDFLSSAIGDLDSLQDNFVNKDDIDSLADKFDDKLANLPKPKNYDSEIDRLEGMINDFPRPKNHTSEIDKLNKSIKELKQKRTHSGDVSVVKSELKRLESEITKLDKKPETRTVKQSDFNAKLSSLTSSIAGINKKISSEESTEKIKRLESENRQLHKKIDKLTNDINQIKQAFEG